MVSTRRRRCGFALASHVRALVAKATYAMGMNARHEWPFLIRYVWSGLVQSPLRSGLSMLGVAVGIAAVLAVVAIGRGAAANLDSQFKSLGSNLLAIEAGIGIAGKSLDTLNVQDVQAMAVQIPQIEVASGVVRVSSATLSHGKSTLQAEVVGVEPDYLQVRSWPIERGMAIHSEHLRDRSSVVLLGGAVAKRLERSNGVPVAIGEWVRINGIPFQVLGVLQAKGKSPLGRDQDSVLLLPLTTAKLRLSFANQNHHIDGVESISVKVRTSSGMKIVEQEVEQLMRQRHHVFDANSRATEISNFADIQKSQARSQSLMTLVLLGIASISLISGGVGVMNMLLFSVTERTREIGVLSALGMPQATIRGLFLLEALLLCLCGGVLGIGLGALASWGLSKWANWPWVLDLTAIAVSLIFTITVGLLAGWWPAHRAATMLPIDALRHKD
jgi:putative ABC transport system permease protein